MRLEQTLNTEHAIYSISKKDSKEEVNHPNMAPFQLVLGLSHHSRLNSLLPYLAFLVIAIFLNDKAFGQNPLQGNEGFQILSEGNLTFTDYTHVHGSTAVGGDLILNNSGVLAEICMDGISSYTYPGDGGVETGLLVAGGVNWTGGGAKVMGGKYFHIGNGAGCIESDNGVNMATQVLPAGAVYNNAKRIEGGLDQTPSPSVFQPSTLDFATIFSNFRDVSEGMANCTNNIQLKDVNDDPIINNEISSPQNIEVSSLSNGVNHLILTQSSLNNITELKFSGSAKPKDSKILIITVPLTSDFVWNNVNMPGLSGSANGAYILWNFSGTTSYQLTVNTASLIIGTIFAPNHHLIKNGTGDIDGNLVAKSIKLGLGEIHLYPFEGDVPSCCSSLTNAGTIGSNQSYCGSSFNPEDLTETSDPVGGSGSLEYLWQVSNDSVSWINISVATSKKYDPPSLNTTTYYRRGARRKGCNTYLYSNIVAINVNTSPTASISGANSICLGENTSLTASGGATYVWNTGETTANVSFSPLSTTTYTVTVTAANGCTATASRTVTVNSLPVASISGNNTICAGTNTNLTASGGSSYLWSNGATTASISVSPSTTSTYSVTVTNSNGCTSTASRTVTVNVAPSASISGENSICSGTTTTLTATGGGSYVWSNGQLSSDINVSPNSTTTYTVTITNANGCTATASHTVTVYSLPSASISGSNNICEGGSTTLNASGGSSYVWSNGATTSSINVSPTFTSTYTVTVTNSNGCTAIASRKVTVNTNPIAVVTGTNIICAGTSTVLSAAGGTSYNWSNGSSSANITVSPSATSTYTVTVTNSSGCTSTASRTVTVNVAPSASISGENSICRGSTTTLTATGGGSYVWSNGQFSSDINVSPNSTTTYTVTVTDANGCTATASRTVTVYSLPTASISGSNNICEGGSTTLNASGGSSYVWSNGATTSSVNVSPSFTSTYTVTVTNSNGCTATASRTVTVNTNPIAIVTGTNIICAGTSTVLSAAGGTSYNWSNGSSSANITVSPSATNTYTVTVTNSSGCTATATRTVTVNASPTTNISGTDEICPGGNANLSASGTGTFIWSNGQTTASISVSPASTTTFTVTITNTNGCTGSDNHTVVVNASPTATITGPAAICDGENATLTASGNSPTTWLWSTGSTTKSISISPTATTAYSVTITNGDGCTATATRTVTVNYNPSAFISGVNTICSGTSTVLSATGGGSYQWSNGSSSQNITVSPASSTTYRVTVTNSSGCTASASMAVTVNGLPTVSVTGTNAICNGGSTTLSASGGTDYIWSNGGTTSSIDVSPALNTTYAVTVTNSNGCTATGSRTVNVVALPSISSHPNGSSVCPGQTVNLSVSATGGTPSLTYQWQSSANNTTFTNISGATSSNYTTPALSTTTYYRAVVSAAGSGCGSVTSNSATATVIPLPAANAGTDFAVCTGTPGTLSASGGVGYTWSHGLGSGAVKTINPTSPTTYTVTVTNSLGCTATDQVYVTIASPVFVNLGVDKTVCNGGSVTMTAIATEGVGPYSYNWSHGLGIADTKTINPTTTTTYVVTVTDSKGCTDTDDIVITVSSSCLENCGNNVDDDGDGLKDCFDMDCPCYAPFICDGKMYQSIRLNQNISGLGVNGDYILYEVKSNPVSLNPIANLNNNGLAGEINSFGFNQQDRFIYGISENYPYKIYRLNADYDVHTLGTITGVPSSFGVMFSADFDRDGNYYVIANKTTSSGSGNINDQIMYKINLNTLVATQVYNFNGYAGISDIAFNPVDNKFYAWYGENHRLIKIDPSNWSATFVGSANNGYDRMIATFFDSEGNLICYADKNSVGGDATYETLVKINVSTGVVTQIGQGLTTDNGDGCSCPYHVRFTKQGPATANSNSTITYTFRIYNQSGLNLSGITFRDTLPTGYSFASNAANLTGGINISGTASGQQIATLTVNNIGAGTSSFTLDVNVPACVLAGSNLSNQAWLEGFQLVTSALPPKIFSDDVNTAIIGDATSTSINCEVCGNGVDDDGDGLVDNNDPDCCSVSVNAGSDKNICQGQSTVLTAVAGAGSSGSCSGTVVSSFPYSESFENTYGAWTQATDDNFDWAVDALGTPTTGTGPLLAANGLYYLYVESSSPNYPSKTTTINSPCFDLGSSGTANFSFSYNMNGSDIGTLYVEISQNNGANWTTLWTASGNKGSSWLNQNVSLNTYVGKVIKLRFRAMTGSGPYGDIAIDNLSLTHTAASLSYLWSNGATTPSITVSPATSTTYTVSITKGICTSTDQVFVSVSAMPTASISGPTTVCLGNAGTLTASGGGTYLWNTGATTASISVLPLLPTNYTVTVTNANGCTATASQTVSLGICVEDCTNGIDDDGDGLVDCADLNCGGLPIANAGADASVCAGSSTILTASASNGIPPYTFTWSNGLGNGASKSVVATSSMSYTVTVTSLTGCTATDLVQVSVHPAPVADAGSNIAICSGSSASFTASATGGTAPYNFAWNNSLGSGASKTVTPSATTTYTVTVTDNNGCTHNDQMTVAVNQTPVANAGPDQSICNSFGTTLSASATGGTTPYFYVWSNGLGTGDTKTVNPASTTTYSVTIVSANGCVSMDQVQVTVQNCPEICNNGLDDDGDGQTDCADLNCGPQVDLGTNVSICNGNSTQLSASVMGGYGNLTYTWSHGLGTGQTKTVSPSVTTTYSVTVTSQSGCTDVAQKTVTVNMCNENCTNGIDDDGDGLVDCNDPDCSGVTAPVLVDDIYTTCPGMPYAERVTYNDGNLQSPSFSIYAQPSNGVVNIDGTGKFIYTPLGTDCNTDMFIYQVCNTTTGCCDEATVTLNFGDGNPPVLSNVPADLTINCDDAIPNPSIVTAFDQCPGVYIDFEETSDLNVAGACGSYTITRTWMATDLCGNSASDQQQIAVLDQTKPEIFQVYTLENGTKVVAGVSQRVTQDWKYVPFPITFSQAPVVLTTLVTDTEISAAAVQQRNVYTQGFQIRLREEETADQLHVGEKVAWLAFEPSSQTGGFAFQAGTFANVGHGVDTLNFAHPFPSSPLFFAALQTAKENDATTIRLKNLNGSSAEFFAQEETSLDSETNHQNETLGLLAIDNNSVIANDKGEVFGEKGQLQVTNAWATVNLSRSYTKPVVIIGNISNNDIDPVTIRVRNSTANSFQVRAQEWGYQDGNHSAENISWMVIEGGIPGNGNYYCSGNIADLRPSINVFAIDNCDDLTAFDYEVSASSQLNAGLLTVRTWMAVDDCGNTNLITRFDTCSTAALQVKGVLYGALMNNGGGDKMRDNLRELKKVPVFEPYSLLSGFPHVDYGEHDSLLLNDNGGIILPEITICHKPGTSEQATINVSVEELAIHLGHGDYIGACGSDNSGMVTICHKPGTSAQKTKVIPQSALLGHLAHGDIIGACSDDDSQTPTAAQDAQYRTIADGLWTASSTWENGNVPPLTNINNKTISIGHNVVIQNSELHLKNNAKLWVTHGSLKLINGNFKIEKSQAYFSNSVFDMATAGNLEIMNNQAVLNFTDCFVTVGQNIKNNGGKLKFENTSLTVSENFENSGGIDSLINVCAIIEGNFKSDYGSSNFMSDAKLRLTNGNFENNFGSAINGLNTVILVENGLLSSLGTWLGSITHYCVSGSVLGLLTNILQGPENCTDIANYFNPCLCESDDNDGGSSSGGGVIGNVLTGAWSDDFSINPGKSFGGGSIAPSVLDITGNDAVVDWLLVELRNPENDKEVLGYATVVLQRDGDIVAENGDSIIMFPGLPEGEYYVTLRHRNHLALMTDIPFFLSTQNTPEIDFSDLSLPVRGGSYAGRIANGKRTLWSGDYNEDGKVIYQGPFNDVFHLFSRVLAEPNNEEILANYIVIGYELADFNLDGRVIYQGPSNDKAPLLYNSILSHPANSSLLANYIVKTMIP